MNFIHKITDEKTSLDKFIWNVITNIKFVIAWEILLIFNSIKTILVFNWESHKNFFNLIQKIQLKWNEKKTQFFKIDLILISIFLHSNNNLTIYE